MKSSITSARTHPSGARTASAGAHLWDWVFWGLFLGASVALVRDTFYQGNDFQVFWRAGKHLLNGEAIYAVGRDGAMPFKYPPWTVWPFALLASFSEPSARWIWGGVEVLSLAYSILWVRTRVEYRVAVYVTAIAFWGIWAVHCLDGQVTLPLLALVLWLYGRWEKQRLGAAVVGIAWALSFKIFTLIALIGLEWRNRWKKLLVGLGVAAGLFLALSQWTASMTHRSTSDLLREYVDTAGSGGEQFDGEKVRGRDNQGFPAFILRLAHEPARNVLGDFWAFALSFLGLAGLWLWGSRGLSSNEAFVSALALSAATHPLAWFHSYVFAFPMAVLALDRAWRSRSVRIQALAVVGVCAIAVLTEKTLGALGSALERASIKAWGVVICFAILGYAARGRNRT